MGMGIGGSAGGSSSTTNQSFNQQTAGTTAGTSAAQKTFSPEQMGLQSSLISALQGLIQGSAAPQVQAQQTQSANQINSEYSSMGDRMNRFLAARGFGQSGASGKAALQTEIGRQGALASNTANYGKIALDTQQQGLSDALNAAYNNLGTTGSTTGATTGTTSGTSKSTTDASNWGVDAKATF